MDPLKLSQRLLFGVGLPNALWLVLLVCLAVSIGSPPATSESNPYSGWDVIAWVIEAGATAFVFVVVFTPCVLFGTLIVGLLRWKRRWAAFLGGLAGVGAGLVTGVAVIAILLWYSDVNLVPKPDQTAILPQIRLFEDIPAELTSSTGTTAWERYDLFREQT